MILDTLFQAFVFPGILFILAWAVFVFWFFRKFLALIHKRVGPYHNGYAGTMQTVYDFSKLLTKESITPKGIDPLLFSSIPILAPVIAITPVAFIPWNGVGSEIVSTEFGVLALIVFVGIEPFLLFLTGFGSNNKYSILGGIRILTQTISMETPFFLSALAPALLFGTMNLSEIVSETSVTSALILLPSFLLFFISVLGVLEQPPFNIPDAEQEVVYGFYTEYSGTNYFLLKLSEFAEFLIVFAMASVLFFGGTKGFFFDSFWCLLLKLLIMAMFMLLIRATTPRLRLSQMLNFSWSYLLPLSFMNLAFVIFAKIYILGGVQ
jgi:NADH-quinone oxidoreductase subunit H